MRATAERMAAEAIVIPLASELASNANSAVLTPYLKEKYNKKGRGEGGVAHSLLS